ncbi:MAG: phage portal protein [Sulfurovaceae bacterium]|nr:phage portal protein [Sulfurovaceae bacterium]
MSIIGKYLNLAPMIMPSKGSGFSFFGFGSSKTITVDNAMQHTTVFACNRVIAETLGSIALEVFKTTDKGKEKATEHPLFNILKLQPNPLMTSVMWREMIVQDLNTRGNHYSQIIRNRLGEVIALYPLKSASMEVVLDENTKIHYIYKVGSKTYEVEAKDILHIRGLPSTDGIKGLSPIEYNRRAIQLSDTAQEFGINFFEKGANGTGAFIIPSELSETSYNRLKKDITDKYAGINNSGKPLLLEGGLKFERFTIPNNDSQFLETRKYQKEDIASIFRVPMHMINSLENATFSNIEHQSLEFVQFTMLPWIKRIEQALTTSLLSTIEQELYSIKFNVDTLLRGDFKTRTEGYRALLSNGVMNINEVRALENLNGIGPNGDEYRVQLNTTAVGETNDNTKN